MANKKRFTFFTEDYPAVTCESCYEDQNEYYTGPAIDRLAEYEATGLMPAEVAALTQELKYAKKQCREERRWIPVTERLPKCGERVLATDGGFVGEFYINKRGQWQRYNVNDSSLLMALDILSWMPLPQPPKEDA